MKVLFYLDRFPAFGGIERITSDLSRLFQSHLSHDVAIFSLQKDDKALHLIPEGLKFYFGGYTEASNKLKECLSEFKPDVVIFQDSYIPVEDILFESRKEFDFKLIIAEHSTPDYSLHGYKERWRNHRWLSPKGFVKRLLYPYVYYNTKRESGLRHRKLVANADTYVLLSNTHKNIFKRLWGIVDNKIIAIPNIKNDFSAKDYSHNEKKKQVLFVGRLSKEKGLRFLVKIWEKIERKYPDWKLVIAGDGELRGYLEDEIKKRELRNVEMKGFVTDIDRLYRESAAIFMTSIFEGLPLVLAEAMQFGVTPFAFDAFSSLHDIYDNRLGYIIPAFKIDQYVRSFDEFTKRDDINQKALNDATLKFTEARILKEWDGLLRSLTDK